MPFYEHGYKQKFTAGFEPTTQGFADLCSDRAELSERRKEAFVACFDFMSKAIEEKETVLQTCTKRAALVNVSGVRV